VKDAVDKLIENEGIKARHVEQCLVCGAKGDSLYSGMRDRLFGAPGVWSIYRCKRNSCGFLWLDPRPLPEDTGRLYTGTYYTHEPPRLSKLKRLGRLIKRSSLGTILFSRMYHQGAHKGRLLEVGCGTGLYLSEMRSLGWSVEGVDFDMGAVKTARGHFNLTVHHGSLEERALASASFDAVTVNHVIEHIHDPVALLRECARVLKPGGRLVITCPNAKSLCHALFKADCYHLDPPRHLYSFSFATLASIVERAGFRMVSLRSTVSAARHIHVTSRRIRSTGTSPPEYMPSRAARALALFFMLCEQLLIVFNREAGEEIVLVADKQVLRGC